MRSSAGSHNIVQKRCQFCTATLFGVNDGQPGTCWGCVDKRDVERETVAAIVAWLRRYQHGMTEGHALAELAFCSDAGLIADAAEAEARGRAEACRERHDLDAINRIAERAVSFSAYGEAVYVVNSADLNAASRLVEKAAAEARKGALEEGVLLLAQQGAEPWVLAVLRALAERKP